MQLRLHSPLRAWEARRALRAERAQADHDILASRIPSPRLAWRVAELLAPDNRLGLGRAIITAVHNADESRLPNASPLDRGAVRVCRADLLELASRLVAVERAVAPRGVVLAHHLVDDSSSPLYGHGDPSRLRGDVRRATSALDGTFNGAGH